jgi:hypothetical protein
MGEVPFGAAARDLEIDEPLVQAVTPDELQMQRKQGLVAQRRGKGDFIERAIETGKVGLEIDEPPAENRRDLLDPVAEEKGAVEDRDLGLFLRHIRAVHIDGARHEREA